ncbi:isocitrate lyase/phosphoenolpyruvate mutase family protein, partial [Spectribacter hydrogenooxidans]
PLADIDEFCGKIRAGKDSQVDPEFCLVARVEALIAGRGMDEALTRAHAYADAGADAILIHSKRSDPDEILTFAERFGARTPLVIVPTTYYATPVDVFRRAGISLVIWANHLLRASVSAMQATAARIQQTRSLVDVEGQVAPVAEVFRLQGAQELLEAERQYAPTGRATRAVVLAASRGEALAGLTSDRPKVMVSVAGQPVLQHLVERFRGAGITDITTVAGYRPDSVEVPGVKVVVNRDYETGGELSSLACARDRLGRDNLLVYGDLLFRDYILTDLLAMKDPLVAVVDSAPTPEHGTQDEVFCSAPDDRGLYRPEIWLEQVGREGVPDGRRPDGRWIGMLRVQGPGCEWLDRALDATPDGAAQGMPDLLNRIIAEGHPVRVLYIVGHWLDVNNLEDLQRADAFARGERGDGRA